MRIGVKVFEVDEGIVDDGCDGGVFLAAFRINNEDRTLFLGIVTGIVPGIICSEQQPI